MKINLLRRLCMLFVTVIVALSVCAAPGERKRKNQELRQTKESFFKTPEARRIGDQLIDFQRITGGWPKNVDMCSPMTAAQLDSVRALKERTDDSTTDNGATNLQMTYLARLYQATGDQKYRDAFIKGVEYLLSGQYDNGGWPQFWPNPQGYQVHITYNDDAMANTMFMLEKVAAGEKPYHGKLTDKALKARARKAFDKGVECILKCQLTYNGQLAVWPQQNHRDTYEAAPARAYELPSFGTQESATLLRLLMSIPNPDERIKRAVHAGMKWMDTYKLTGIREDHFVTPGGIRDVRIVEDPHATEPIWGRYYDLVNCEPYVCDRDGIPRRHLEQIGHERRNGYGWFSSRQGMIYPIYDEWAARYDPENKVNVSLRTPGANETGLIEMYRKPQMAREAFDAVVRPGESIQAAIEAAPKDGKKPYKILISKGLYNQKVVIDRPNIVLVGEDRDSTVIQIAEISDRPFMAEFKGEPVHIGTIVIQEGADDVVISGLTVSNNYGSTIEPTTTHQFAVYGRGTRTIVINSNIHADGNDALSLWAREGGMYYHADLRIECPGVDFLCPRGWCYATRCELIGDSRAIIWHDGRGDRDKKLVITNSRFDAKSPTPLGRYHHDSQFYLIDCELGQNILDQNISYAYTDKVLDPCPWGQRTYYYGCYRDGGNGPWLENNLDKAPGRPPFHAITASWTFDNKWDPEKRIRELWDVLAY